MHHTMGLLLSSYVLVLSFATHIRKEVEARKGQALGLLQGEQEGKMFKRGLGGGVFGVREV